MTMRNHKFKQVRKVQIRNVDGEIFLIDDVARSIHHTNHLGLAIWRLSRKAISAQDVVSLLCAAFPDQPKRALRSDYLKLQRQLLNAGLIQRVP